MAGAAAGAAAAAAAMLQAVRACGVIVYVEPEEFLGVLGRQQAPLVVQAKVAGLFRTRHQYLTSYKGLAFYARCPEALTLPPGCELVKAASIWVPG
jgi:hypothetical protein